MVLLFDKVNKIIEVEAPQQTVFVADLYDSIKEFDDEPHNLEIPVFAAASGGEDLGGGVFVGFTLQLIDWKLKFTGWGGPSYTACEVTGGNLLSYDTGLGDFVNPIEPAAFVTVTRTTSSSATVKELEIVNIQRLIETQRAHHTGTGSIWYWDPYNGLDTNSGIEPNKAFKTFAKAQEEAEDFHHDIIFALSGNPAGQTVTNEPVVITKNFLFLRGPGRDFKIVITDDTKSPVTLNAGNMGSEVSGMILETAATGSAPAVFIDGANFFLLNDLWIEDCVGHGVHVLNSEHGYVHCVDINGAGGSCIYVGDTVSHLEICHECVLLAAVGDGINLAGSGIDHVEIESCSITDNGAYGIRVGSGAAHTFLGTVNVNLANNTSGSVLDNGTDTVWGMEENRALIAEDVVAGGAATESSVQDVKALVEFVKDIEGGRWEIDGVNSQMIFYKADNITEVARFDLKDINGEAVDPTKVLIHDRARV